MNNNLEDCVGAGRLLSKKAKINRYMREREREHERKRKSEREREMWER